MTEQNPPLDQLADAADSLGWERERHGTFAECATDDDAVLTVPADEYRPREET